MNETYLVYYVSELPGMGSFIIETPCGARYLRVVEYRGGADALDWAERNRRDHEVFLNTVLVDKNPAYLQRP